MPLDEQAALALAGPDPHDVDSARDVEPVTAADVKAAEKAAEQADANATRAEHMALAGQTPPSQAAADREAARFASLRAAVTRRRAERHARAQRIMALHQLGQAALKHAAALQDLKTATAADLQTISELQQAIRDRAQAWNDELASLIHQTAALEPEKPRPGMVPAPSSAHVYAAGNPPVFVVRNQVLTTIGTHPDGELAAVGAAHRETRQHDPSVRLIRGENGVIVPLGTDPGGHLQRRIREGTIHELTLAEKKSYYDGGAA